MAKRCIGIDMSSNCLSAAQLWLEDGNLRIEKTFNAKTRRNTDSPSQLLRALFNDHGFDGSARVAVSIPNESVYFRTLRTDSANLDRLRDDTVAALENNLPFNKDRIIAQLCCSRRLSDDNYSVLAAAMEKTSFHQCINILAEARIKPDCVEPAILAVHRIVTLNHPAAADGRAVIAYIDHSHLVLAVTENNDILIVRNVPIGPVSDSGADLAQYQIAGLLSRETEITWRKLFTEELTDQTILYLAAEHRVTEDFQAAVAEALTCTAVIVQPCAKLKSSLEQSTHNALWIAKGLALGILTPDETSTVNFLQADTADMQPEINAKKEVMTFGLLIAAIVVVSSVGLFTRLSSLEAKYTNLTNETRNVFHAALPQVRNVVSPVVQLDQQLQSLRKDYQLFAPFGPTKLAPLMVLSNITKSIPPHMNIQVNEMLVTTQSVRIRAACDSFDTAYQWESLLQKIDGFELAEVQDDIERLPDTGIVNFTILIPAKTEQKI